MKKINQLLVFMLGILVVSCVDQQDEITQLDNVIPEGSREVKINVAPSFDLSNTIAYGMYDTLVMNSSSGSLAVPIGAKDIVYFVDKDSKKILAAASLKSSENEIAINAETVTAALHDILPSYLRLSAEDKLKFSESATNSSEYKKLVSTVDQIMKSGESIFKANSEYVADLRAVSNYISENFSTSKGNKVASRTTTQDLRYWIKSGAPLRIANQSFTYVNAVFTPENGGPASSYLLNPRPITFDYSQESIREFNKPDGYYTLKLTQRMDEARAKNEYGFANNLLNMSLGENYWNMVDGDGGEGCFQGMMDYIEEDMNRIYANPPTDAFSFYNLALATMFKVIPYFVSNQNCIQFFGSNEMAAHILSERTMLLSEVLEPYAFLEELGGFVFYFEANYVPFEFENRIKIEDGAIKW